MSIFSIYVDTYLAYVDIFNKYNHIGVNRSWRVEIRATKPKKSILGNPTSVYPDPFSTFRNPYSYGEMPGGKSDILKRDIVLFNELVKRLEFMLLPSGIVKIFVKQDDGTWLYLSC